MKSTSAFSTWAGHVAKVAVAAGVLWFMAHSGKLRFEAVLAAGRNWPDVLGCAALVIFSVWVTSVRWRLLLRGQGIFLGFGKTYSLTMIGTLFSMVIPGSVSGDVVKAYYVSHEAPGRRALAFGTILMDRIVGLASLSAVATAGVLWNHQLVFANRTLSAFGLFAVTGCLCGCAGVLVAVRGSAWVHGLILRLPERLPLRGFAIAVTEVLASYRGQIPRLALAFLMSVPAHAALCGGILFCLRAAGGPVVMPPRLLLFTVPLAMLATSIPITPAGIGVGQAAFYAICNLVMVGTGPAAANAFTVFQAIALPVYLLGLIPYLVYRKSSPEPVD